MIRLSILFRADYQKMALRTLRVFNKRYNIRVVADFTRGPMPPDERCCYESNQDKNAIKAAVAAVGFAVVLFAPTGCLATTATTAPADSGCGLLGLGCVL